MKKIYLLISISCMCFVMAACKKEQPINDDGIIIYEENTVSNNAVVGVEQNNEVENEEPVREVKPDNIVSIPDMGYEATLKDEDGNVLFAYYVPLGWLNDDSPAYGDYVSTKLVREVEGIWGQQVDLACRKNKGYVELYDTGRVNSQYLDTADGQSYTYEGEAETPYGTFKFFHLHEPDEYVSDRELAIFKLNDKWCVVYSIALGEFMYDTAYGFLKNTVEMTLLGKEKMVNIPQDYEYYLEGMNGEKILGFNIPDNMEIGDWTDSDQKIWLDNTTGSFRKICLEEITYYQTLPIYGKYNFDYEFKKMGSVETIYGTADLYAYIDGESKRYCEEAAILNVNGHYIEILYRTGGEIYTGDLENILNSELF